MCVCVSLCLSVRDPDGAPGIVRLRRGGGRGRGRMGPPFSTILGFCLLTAMAAPHLMSPLSLPPCLCVGACMCARVQRLYLLSILLMAILQVDETITHSHLFFSLYINLCLSVCPLSLLPSLLFIFSILLLSLFLCRPSSFYSVPPSLPSCLPPVR